jgi:hypothetical protein
MPKITELVAILALLILAACQTQPRPRADLEPPVAIASPASFEGLRGGPLGIDLSIDTGDVLDQLRNGRVDFIARYYRDPVSSWPALSAGEARRLSSLGLKIVAVWEPSSPVPEYFTYSSGYDDAIAAYRQAKAVGQPAGSAIYFAIDFNAEDLASIEQYFQGVAAGFGAASGGSAEYKIGVYGSGAVCDAVKGAGLAQYSWLSNSTAWDGSSGYADWNIRQGEALADFSFENDSDEARGEYGAFRLDAQDGGTPQGSQPAS